MLISAATTAVALEVLERHSGALRAGQRASARANRIGSCSHSPSAHIKLLMRFVSAGKRAAARRRAKSPASKNLVHWPRPDSLSHARRPAAIYKSSHADGHLDQAPGQRKAIALPGHKVATALMLISGPRRSARHWRRRSLAQPNQQQIAKRRGFSRAPLHFYRLWRRCDPTRRPLGDINFHHGTSLQASLPRPID